MTRGEIQKLLGGYATGTLTPEEQQALFAAALDDQELFDALAREQALRDLLRDPAARAQVLAAIDERSAGWWRRATQWMLRPAGGAAIAACLAAVAGYAVWHARQTPAPALVAGNRPAEVAPAPSA
jgi:ferric-dicitrate binding protein FerR (iron transport regulator)